MPPEVREGVTPSPKLTSPAADRDRRPPAEAQPAAADFHRAESEGMSADSPEPVRHPPASNARSKRKHQHATMFLVILSDLTRASCSRGDSIALL